VAVQRLICAHLVVALCLLVVVAGAGAAPRLAPVAHVAATCSDYPNQAAAQRAADTRDGDGDGVYCESLPCPCATRGSAPQQRPAKPKPRQRRSCRKPSGVQDLVFSAAKYPNIRRHFLAALDKGWPRVLTLHRRHDSRRRDDLLAGYPTRRGYDRDEYPPAIGRATWRADVAYVPSSENRSHGASMGAKLRGLCAGTRFRYVFS
jgi:hypothetical protein